MFQQSYQIEFTNINKAKNSIEKVLNNFWNEAISKINKYKSIRNNVNNNSSIQIKAEPIDFEFNSDQREFNHISSLTVLEEVVEPNDENDNKEIEFNLINKEELTFSKLSNNQNRRRNQIKLRNSLSVGKAICSFFQLSHFKSDEFVLKYERQLLKLFSMQSNKNLSRFIFI